MSSFNMKHFFSNRTSGMDASDGYFAPKNNSSIFRSNLGTSSSHSNISINAAQNQSMPNIILSSADKNQQQQQQVPSSNMKEALKDWLIGKQDIQVEQFIRVNSSSNLLFSNALNSKGFKISKSNRQSHNNSFSNIAPSSFARNSQNIMNMSSSISHNMNESVNESQFIDQMSSSIEINTSKRPRSRLLKQHFDNLSETQDSQSTFDSSTLQYIPNNTSINGSVQNSLIFNNYNSAIQLPKPAENFQEISSLAYIKEIEAKNRSKITKRQSFEINDESLSQKKKISPFILSSPSSQKNETKNMNQEQIPSKNKSISSFPIPLNFTDFLEDDQKQQSITSLPSLKSNLLKQPPSLQLRQISAFDSLKHINLSSQSLPSINYTNANYQQQIQQLNQSQTPQHQGFSPTSPQQNLSNEKTKQQSTNSSSFSSGYNIDSNFQIRNISSQRRSIAASVGRRIIQDSSNERKSQSRGILKSKMSIPAIKKCVIFNERVVQYNI